MPCTTRNILLIVLRIWLLLISANLFAGVNVLTYHNDNARTGLNTNETVLTPATVSGPNFGKLFSLAVDGYVYAQPLIVTGVTIPGQGTHDVVYVVTEHDSVYAFDANSSGPPLWQVSFINPAAGITTVSSEDVDCGDMVPEIGITSTPVIDAVGGTIYVSAKTKETTTNGVNFYHRLHALDLTTGAEKFGGPMPMVASVAGTGDGTDGAGHVAFNPLTQFNRTALLLSKGVVYIGSASHCDNGPYHGWLLGYNAQTLALSNLFNTTPNGSDGGIWQAGTGPASDTNGSIFFITGNGTFNTNAAVKCYGDSFLKLSVTNGLKLADYFTPFDQAVMNSEDLDLGSGGIMLLPDEAGGVTTNRHLLIGAGKEGTVYLINREAMRHYNATNNNQIIQSLYGAIGDCFSGPAYLNKTIYYLGANDKLKAFSITGARLSTVPIAQGSTTFGYPGATPSISANGTNNGIVWVVQTDAYSSSGPATLHAYNAANVGAELYNSNQAGSRDVAGSAVKFTVPTVANGKVYVGGQYSLSVYGTGTFLPTPVITPASGTFLNAATLTLTDGSAGASFYYTIDGSTPTTNSILYTGPFVITNSTSLRVVAVQPGAVASSIASGFIAITHYTDLVPPTCTISAPTPNQRCSNAVITVAGTAADNLGLANVFFNLNHSGWTPASTANNWTNWTAQANLMAGTNAISVYAQDLAGNVSRTNTTSFFYVVSAPLVVGTNINGGVIAPPYNNALLQVGSTYVMTAIPKAGFIFKSWTDGNDQVVSTSPTLRFVMTPAAAYTANFQDIIKPTLAVTNPPLTGARTSNSTYVVAGRAWDNISVTGVQYNFNQSGWRSAASANGWSNWTAQVSLMPGTNLISIYATDFAGNCSLTNNMAVVYVVSSPLTVAINGRGLVVPSLNNAQLQIGANYSVTAIPSAGFSFDGWTDVFGNQITNKANLIFNMATNLSLTANFLDITRPTATVTTPTIFTSATNEFYLATGRAADNVAVTNVAFQLNQNGWYNAYSTNAWTNWNVMLDLAPGINSFAAYATDSSGNSSATNTVKFLYPTAPASLVGWKAVVTNDNNNLYSFGGNTFNNVYGVGNYTYARLSPSSGRLIFHLSAPPSLTNIGVVTKNLVFTSPNIGQDPNDPDQFIWSFGPTQGLTPAFIFNQSLLMVDTSGSAIKVVYSIGRYASSNLLDGATNYGSSYTYYPYGPMGALVRQLGSNYITYIGLNYLETNNGSFWMESHNASGALITQTTGTFGMASQYPGGNTPATLANRTALVTSLTTQFKLAFPDGVNFVQLDPVDNSITNATGTYVYWQSGTNTSSLTLTYNSPVETNSVTLNFIAPNFSYFINSDNTVGSAVWK